MKPSRIAAFVLVLAAAGWIASGHFGDARTPSAPEGPELVTMTVNVTGWLTVALIVRGDTSIETLACGVTITSALADQNVPSLSSATATSVCVVASRMRVATLARPARGPR